MTLKEFLIGTTVSGVKLVVTAGNEDWNDVGECFLSEGHYVNLDFWIDWDENKDVFNEKADTAVPKWFKSWLDRVILDINVHVSADEIIEVTDGLINDPCPVMNICLHGEAGDEELLNTLKEKPVIDSNYFIKHIFDAPYYPYASSVNFEAAHAVKEIWDKYGLTNYCFAMSLLLFHGWATVKEWTDDDVKNHTQPQFAHITKKLADCFTKQEDLYGVLVYLGKYIDRYY